MNQSKGVSCFVFVFCAVLVVSIIIASCGISEDPFNPTLVDGGYSFLKTPIVATSTSKPIPSTTPESEQYNFLLLGGDHKQHRIGTAYGNKTDVMLLVRITMSNPVQIRVIQFPRNLYHPIEAFPDMWLFAVYGLEDMVGLHYYFQQVFDVDLQGIAYIHMDNFEQFVDGLGGIHYGATVHSGEETLEYLRDNDNNWSCPEYDCANRQLEVLKALAERVKTQFSGNAVVTTGLLVDSYGHLFDTDLSAWEQIHWLVELGWDIATSDYEITFDKVTESGVVYNDTPLEVRGWTIPDIDKMKAWMK